MDLRFLKERYDFELHCKDRARVALFTALICTTAAGVLYVLDQNGDVKNAGNQKLRSSSNRLQRRKTRRPGHRRSAEQGSCDRDLRCGRQVTPSRSAQGQYQGRHQVRESGGDTMA